MPARSAIPVLLVLALSACVPAGASAATAANRPNLVVGIADQKPDMFSDSRLGSLGIGHARLNVGWDWYRVGYERAQIAEWLAGASASGVAPLISFGASRRRFKDLPTTRQFRASLRKLRARWPEVRDIAVWNEANLCGQPTCRKPALVARYYRALRRECPSCTVLAAELLDLPNMVGWIRAFRRKLGYTPKYWGLHNYVDANRFRTSGTRRILRALPEATRVWLTETGGIVRRNNGSRTKLCRGIAHAAAATRWVFDRLVPLSRRIERVYIYHWDASTVRGTWDSGLIDARGRERPAYRVVRRVIRTGVRPGTAHRRSCRARTG